MSSAPRRSSATPDAGGDPGLNDYLHKTVAFRFEGHTLRLALWQSLFSSYDVDSGSRLLLASVVRQLAAHPGERRRLRSILDLGCGTGVLGLALTKRFAAALTARDRDAPALAVTAHNAAANGVACYTRGCGHQRSGWLAGTCPPPNGRGQPARQGRRPGAGTAAGSGRVAVVVVAPLAEEVRRGLSAVAELIHEQHGSRHAVFHGWPHSPARTPGATGLTAYRRHQRGRSRSPASATRSPRCTGYPTSTPQVTSCSSRLPCCAATRCRRRKSDWSVHVLRRFTTRSRTGGFRALGSLSRRDVIRGGSASSLRRM